MADVQQPVETESEHESSVPEAEALSSESPFANFNLRDCRRVAKTQFRIDNLLPQQAEAMSALCKGLDTMAVLPTGSGKSLIYQVLAMLMDRPVVTLFPLIALMQDQERSLQRNSVPVVRLDSTLGVKARREALARVREGGKLVILTTPETLESEDLKEALKPARPALLCVDEAHCISEWGHDFRPAYLRVGMERAALGVESVLALTATATPKVQDDIVGRLQMKKPAIITSPPYRDNLQLSVRNVPGSIKMAAAGKLIRRLSRPGIVYCATTKAVDEIFGALKRAGIPVARYHGRMTKTERVRAQKKFVQRRGRMVMVATSAFGMGIDKPNIRYIMHYQVPGSVEQYVQEIGRAGRDGRPARCVLLFDEADLDIQKRLAAKSHVNASQLKSLGDAIVAWAEADRSVTVEDLALSAQVVTTACRALCNQIEEAGLIERDGSKALRAKVDIETLRNGVAELAEQFAIVQREDLRRINRIAEYALTKECRSVFMRRWFGEETPPECGRCDNCREGQSSESFRSGARPTESDDRQSRRRGGDSSDDRRGRNRNPTRADARDDDQQIQRRDGAGTSNEENRRRSEAKKDERKSRRRAAASKSEGQNQRRGEGKNNDRQSRRRSGGNKGNGQNQRRGEGNNGNRQNQRRGEGNNGNRQNQQRGEGNNGNRQNQQRGEGNNGNRQNQQRGEGNRQRRRRSKPAQPSS